MLSRSTRAVYLWLSATLILTYTCVFLYSSHVFYLSPPGKAPYGSVDISNSSSSFEGGASSLANESGAVKPGIHQSNARFTATVTVSESHHEIFSQSTTDGRYFIIDFGTRRAMNPNIIPHPFREETWYIIAQAYKEHDDNQRWFTELVCEANFRNESFQCLDEPSILPIASTSSLHCNGDLNFFDDNIGPHDARVFYGPKAPYIVYGSQSHSNCFGLWMQDFRRLVNWKHEPSAVEAFRMATDLEKPGSKADVEKNWFAFWDDEGHMYMHHDLLPKRIFAKQFWDGSVGEDLATVNHDHDSRCLQRSWELQANNNRVFHQASNSLAITMCQAKDPQCRRTSNNTFILTVIQEKKYEDWHSVYEPYVVLFQQTAPFAIHSVSRKPIWVHGRKTAGDRQRNEATPRGQTEMLYVTSLSWRNQERRYSGYLDDILFLNFGIEDSSAGSIDVLVSDLLEQMEECYDVA